MKLLSAIFALSLTGCATMRDSTTQPVLIGSSPPGATIYRDGQPVGRTPMFVDLSRRSRPNLTLATMSGPVGIALDRSYRWRDSFWPNLVFWYFAPIGWATDLISGAALRYRTPASPTIALAAGDRRPPPARAQILAIAPPASDEPALSDAAGLALEETLRNRRGLSVRPYRQTLPTFLVNGYDFDGVPPEVDRGALYQGLGADVIYESRVEHADDRLILKSRANHVLTGRVAPAPDLELDGSSRIDRLLTRRAWWSFLVPNLIALDFAATRIALQNGDRSFRLEPPANENQLTRWLDYLSAVKISSLPARRLERSLRWRFSFVPTVRASRRTVTSPELPIGLTIQNINARYTRSLVGIGYGPEIGLQSGRHYVYVNGLPLVTHSWVDGPSGTKDSGGLQFSGELGYIYYLSSSWNVRLFSRSQIEDSSVWQAALADRLGNAKQTATVTSFVSGLSVGYRFEPSARARRR